MIWILVVIGVIGLLFCGGSDSGSSTNYNKDDYYDETYEEDMETGFLDDDDD